eukprot:m.491883 g.491883  ORF g.491883 m.491883 type:complete len:553 (-) comp30916_c0_seq1:110-1768(-)
MLNTRNESFVRLLLLSAQAAVSEAALPIATLVAVGVLGHHHDPGHKPSPPPSAAVASSTGTTTATPSEVVAAFAAVEAVLTFVANITNFLVVVTMAQLTKARSHGDARAVRLRGLLALGVAGGLGVTLAGVVYALRTPLVQELYALSPAVRHLVPPYLPWRLGCLPLLFVQRACAGILGGCHRLGMLTVLQVLNAAAYALAVYVAAGVLHKPLSHVGAAIFATQVPSTLAFLLGAAKALRSEQRDATSGKNSSKGKGKHDSDTGRPDQAPEPAAGTATTRRGCCPAVVVEYLSKSGDLVVRSVLLQATVFALSIGAGHLGTHTLAAHQVLIQLWMVTSYVVDGTADVATMVGAHLVARGDGVRMRRLTWRLGLVAGVTGAVASIVFFAAEAPIQRLFTSDMAVRHALAEAWPVLAGFQLVNALVFFLDGAVFAFQAFSFVRNVMLVGFFVLFLPAFLAALLHWHAWLGLWIAKGLLNSWRCGTAMAYVLAIGLPGLSRRGGSEDKTVTSVATDAAAATLAAPAPSVFATGIQQHHGDDDMGTEKQPLLTEPP